MSVTELKEDINSISYILHNLNNKEKKEEIESLSLFFVQKYKEQLKHITAVSKTDSSAHIFKLLLGWLKHELDNEIYKSTANFSRPTPSRSTTPSRSFTPFKLASQTRSTTPTRSITPTRSTTPTKLTLPNKPEDQLKLFYELKTEEEQSKNEIQQLEKVATKMVQQMTPEQKKDFFENVPEVEQLNHMKQELNLFGNDLYALKMTMNNPNLPPEIQKVAFEKFWEGRLKEQEGSNKLKSALKWVTILAALAGTAYVGALSFGVGTDAAAKLMSTPGFQDVMDTTEDIITSVTSLSPTAAPINAAKIMTNKEKTDNAINAGKTVYQGVKGEVKELNDYVWSGLKSFGNSVKGAFLGNTPPNELANPTSTAVPLEQPTAPIPLSAPDPNGLPAPELTTQPAPIPTSLSTAENVKAYPLANGKVVYLPSIDEIQQS
jgi:hypothetical protein